MSSQGDEESEEDELLRDQLEFHEGDEDLDAKKKKKEG